MYKKIFFIGTLVLAIAVTIFFLVQGKMNPKNDKGTPSASPTAIQAAATTVTYTKSGFNPTTITVKSGTRVTWFNKSGGNATVNSDEYPTNKKFPFLNLGEFGDGSSVQVVFNKAGTFTYYNYFTPEQRGTVTVQ